ncbi:hypothetical protein C2845_PM11G05420 [Panicum miliaceum]|uniref:Uncharacterized protein n=1 Tax=Panicum miliaceum TaxID=4540 RepID=A0A3L6RQU9_PANMI|nr:hypothetical protein C2845_PM11G05420 [Panicum miliaceum]
MAPPLTGGSGTLERRLLQASADGDLRLFKGTLILGGLLIRAAGIASALDGGKGRIAEAVAVCTYLVEELHLDVNTTDDSGETPLAYAVRGGTVETVRFLLDHGMCGMIEALVSRGADVDSFSYCGTPLHAAVIGKQDAAVKVLLDHHADGVGQLTPLIVAANEGLTDFYKCLLDAGADPDVRDDAYERWSIS